MNGIATADAPARIILDSTVMFVLAFTITTILHEVAHATAGLMLGSRSILHDTFVEHHGLSESGGAITAAAGPVFSLVQGLVLFALFARMDAAPRLARLFLLWMALHGLVNCFGYLINTPFFQQGDIGQVAAYLGFSRPAQFGLLAAGVAANLGIGLLATRPFLELAASAHLVSTPGARTDYMLHVAVFPWILGAALVIAIRYPPRFWMILVYPAMSGLFTLVSWDRAAFIQHVRTSPTASSHGSLAVWLIVLVLTLAVFRFVLAPGIRFGRRMP